MITQEKTITLFTTRVRQLMLRFEEYRKANEELRAQLKDRDAVIKDLEEKLRRKEKDYKTLKTARMLEVSDEDMDVAKAKITKLIRNVNKCITLLSEK